MHRVFDRGASQTAELLRSRNWLHTHRLAEGERFDFVGSEPSFSGTFHIDKISHEEGLERTGVREGERRVTGTFKTEGSETYVLSLKDGTEVRGTSHHPLYSLDRGGWTGLAQLVPGERLRTRRGVAVVSRVLEHEQRDTVYNLEVSGAHQYFVSEATLLTHNVYLEPIVRAAKDKILVQQVGRVSETMTFRPHELPYQLPNNSFVAKGEVSFDILNKNVTYLWLVDRRGRFIFGRESQHANNHRRVIKHRDLVAEDRNGQMGQGRARAGGEFIAEKVDGAWTGKWLFDGSSSFMFNRKDGRTLGRENVRAMIRLLRHRGTRTDHLKVVDSVR